MAKRVDWDFIKLCVVVVLFFCTCTVKCQEKKDLPHGTKHTDTIEQQDEMRFMFITVTDKTNNQIIFYRNGTKQIEVSFLFIDEETIIKDGGAKPPYKYTGCWAALICLKHAYIYWLERVPCTDKTGSFYFKGG